MSEELNGLLKSEAPFIGQLFKCRITQLVQLTGNQNELSSVTLTGPDSKLVYAEQW